MKVAALISGGKDSIYALYKSQKEHEVEVLIAIKSKNQDSYMFHRPNIELVELQAKALEIPLIMKETEGKKEKELDDLKDVIKECKEKYQIEGIVSGAIESNYQRKRIENICEELKLKSITPLWHINPKKYMKELLSKFKVIIVKVACDGLNKELLGKEIDLEEIEKLSKKYRFHLAFEGGEAETFVLNGPNFSKKIEIKNSEISWNEKEGYGKIDINAMLLKK